MIKINNCTSPISGIYLIYNKVTNKGYVGSSSNVIKRIFGKSKCHHLLALIKGCHKNKKLQNSFNKHGIDNFEFYLLASCPEEYLIKMEQWFIDNYHSEYNILRVAGRLTGYTHSEETRAKLSNSNKGKGSFKTGKDNISATIVCNYNSKGELISKYYTSIEAAKMTGLRRTQIDASMYANRDKVFMKSGIYYWLNFKNESDVLEKVTIEKPKKEIRFIIAENDEVCHIFRGLRPAVQTIGGNTNTLKKYLNKEKYYGYNWRIKEV